MQPATEAQYTRLAHGFLQFCLFHHRGWSTLSELDGTLVEYMNSLFCEGRPGNDGPRLLAAPSHFMPTLYKAKLTALPRASRCAQAWMRRTPGQQRLPLPRAAALAISGVLLARGRPRMAVHVALNFVAYLRPVESFRLLGRHLTPPSPSAGKEYSHWGLLLADAWCGLPGKTGNWDESVLLDLDPWLIPVIAALRLAVRDDEPIWDFTPAALRKEFASAVELLSLSSLEPHLYSLRHGGASDDLLRRRRSVEEVLRRGRWRCQDSAPVRQGDALLGQLRSVPDDVMKFGLLVGDHFAAVVEGGIMRSSFWDQVPLSVQRALATSVAVQPARKRARR